MITIFIILMITLSIQTEPLSRPESAALPHRQFGNNALNQTHSNDGTNMLINADKFILPVKEYSNKFLRDERTNEEVVYPHGVLKPKNQITYTRKQIKNRKCRRLKLIDNKENEIKRAKTEMSELTSTNQSAEKFRSVKSSNAQAERSFSTPNNKEKPSMSRAFQVFSKVFRNETLQRMRIRREIICRELDVPVKQIKLNGKDRKPKCVVGLARRFNMHPCSILQKPKPRNLMIEEENFELAGW